MRTMRPSVIAAATPRVLIVDGDADTRAMYRRTLTALIECNVVDAADGRDALVNALTFPPSLIITELRLPLMDGFALCEILRQDRITTTVPIVIVAAEARPAELDRLRKVANSVLTKPTLPETLASEAKRLLTGASERREHPASTRAIAADRGGAKRRTVLSKVHARMTTTMPPKPPPMLTCPSCDRALIYEFSHVGGVSERHMEQWDYFRCSSCGSFEYRQRTRKVRRLGTDEEQWVNGLKKSG